MAQEREPLFYVAAGEKSSGKTYYTKNVIIANCIIGSKDVPPKKVIVVDVNNEYPYRTLPVIINETYNSIVLFNKQPIIEVRKVSVFKNDGERKTPNELKADLLTILKYFKNGLLVVEDLNRIMSNHVSSEIYGYLCTNRHINVDILINVQNIGRAGHPAIASTMNILRMHHVKEDAYRHADKFEDRIHIIKIAQLIINNRYEIGIREKRKLEAQGKGKGDKTYDAWDVNYIKFFVYINFDENLISGNFSKEEFRDAATNYIYENENDTIKPLLRRRDSNGKYLYNYKSAFEKSVENITLQYYGNR